MLTSATDFNIILIVVFQTHTSVKWHRCSRWRFSSPFFLCILISIFFYSFFLVWSMRFKKVLIYAALFLIRSFIIQALFCKRFYLILTWYFNRKLICISISGKAFEYERDLEYCPIQVETIFRFVLIKETTFYMGKCSTKLILILLILLPLIL